VSAEPQGSHEREAGGEHQGAAAAPWVPEREVPPELVRRLLVAQFTGRFDADAPLADLGVGWDNRAYLATDREGAEWVLRLPRRAVGAELMEVELAVLPLVASALADAALAVPDPTLVGRPSGDYPWPFGGYRALPGATACSVTVPASVRAAGAATLGKFLGRLHGLGADERVQAVAPQDTIGRTAQPKRLGQLLERLDALVDPESPGAPAGRPGARPAAGGELSVSVGVFPGGLTVEPREVRARAIELAEAAPWSAGTPRLQHGDLYARHLLVDGVGLPAGLIDWGDTHLGDPAMDLSIAWSFLAGEARADLVAAYERSFGVGVDQATRDRARFRALFYGVVLVQYGRDVADERIERVGHEALERGLAD